MKKKVLQIFLLLVLLLSVFSFPVFGEEKIVKLNSNNNLEVVPGSDEKNIERGTAKVTFQGILDLF